MLQTYSLVKYNVGKLNLLSNIPIPQEQACFPQLSAKGTGIMPTPAMVYTLTVLLYQYKMIEYINLQ